MIKETPLQPIIESFERVKATITSEDMIKGIDFALEVVRSYERIVELKIENAKIDGANEQLREINEKLSKR
jgi:hypothetical protein